MSTYPPLPDEEPGSVDAAKAKALRAKDAEKIRQDFVKSHQLPVKSAAGQQPSTEATEDDY